MILGIGVDIVDINSFQETFLQNERFKQRVFTQREIEYCESRTNKIQHYAARFAVKEAVMKAIGTGWDKGVHWKLIEILNINNSESDIAKGNENDLSGKPEIKIHGNLLDSTNNLISTKILVSISHCTSTAIAFVIIEKELILEK